MSDLCYFRSPHNSAIPFLPGIERRLSRMAQRSCLWNQQEEWFLVPNIITVFDLMFKTNTLPDDKIIQQPYYTGNFPLLLHLPVFMPNSDMFFRITGHVSSGFLIIKRVHAETIAAAWSTMFCSPGAGIAQLSAPYCLTIS